MKEYLTQQVRASDPLAARHVVREILQAKVLASLQRAGAMIPLAFHGGTSLRFLYSIQGFSEGLGFALERLGSSYDFRAKVVEDVRPFVESQAELEVLRQDNLSGALARRRLNHRK